MSREVKTQARHAKWLPLDEVLRFRASVSMAEFARYIGRCEATVRNMINRGDISATKSGRAVLIPISELRRMMESEVSS